MRATALSVSVALLMLGAVRAQVWPTATAAGVTVRAGGVLAAPVVPGSDVWSGFSRSCTGLVGAAHCTALHQLSSTRVDAQWTLLCQAYQSGSSASEATIRYELWSSTPVVGQLVITWTPTATGTGSAALGVDWLDDGSIEATTTAVLPVTIGPGVVPFRVRATCNAIAGIVGGFGSNWSYSGSAQAALSLRFEPTPCVTQLVGAACGTPQLGAFANLLPGVDLVGDFDPETEIAVLIVGFAGAALPLPLSLPPSCSVWVAPVAIDWQLVGAQQRAGWALVVPQALRPATFRAQMLGLDIETSSLATSGALQITCQ